jgi:hypothetical protein
MVAALFLARYKADDKTLVRLPRLGPLYTRVAALLRSWGSHWDKHARAHRFPGDAQQTITAAIKQSGVAPDAQLAAKLKPRTFEPAKPAKSETAKS